MLDPSRALPVASSAADIPAGDRDGRAVLRDSAGAVRWPGDTGVSSPVGGNPGCNSGARYHMMRR